MQQTDLPIQNELGLHARPAANFVELAQQYTCELVLIKEGQQANAKSILSLMTLDVRPGDHVTLQADGPDEAEAIQALLGLAARNFGEAE